MSAGPPPRAPWGRFPLSELLVALALICAVAGAVTWGSSRSGWLIAAATVFGCLAGLEVALREHLAGRRSRSGLLAGTIAALAAVPLFLLKVPAPVVLPALAVVYVIAWLALESRFTTRDASRRR